MTSETSSLKVGVPRETFPGEQRVGLVPAAVKPLAKSGYSVLVESNAGRAAGFLDEAYQEAGAQIIASRDELFLAADLIACVRAGGANLGASESDHTRYRSGQILVGHLDPLSAPEEIRRLSQEGVTAYSLELLPRITRAQSMDVLSSMATIAGYKAVLIAADRLPRMFPMMMTAAGTVKPAKVFIMGAGVAGLQAIATAKRLGAVVFAYDVRPAVKEQVESLGGKFVELNLDTATAEGKGGYAKEMGEEFLQRQREELKKTIAECDVVITTALIPGKKAPILLTAEMVSAMAPGSLVVDLAAERGGNCELTQPGESCEVGGVTIIGPVNLAASIPYHASEMYSKNVTTFLTHLGKTGLREPDLSDEILHDTLLTQHGNITNERVRDLLGMQPLTPPEPVETAASHPTATSETHSEQPPSESETGDAQS